MPYETRHLIIVNRLSWELTEERLSKDNVLVSRITLDSIKEVNVIK